MMKFFWTLVLIVLTAFIFYTPASGQEYPNLEKSKYISRMERGVKLMEAGEYEAADKEFKYILKNADALPQNISYFFGANSYYLGNYRQSISWLNKYLELQGATSRYSEKAAEIVELAEEAYRSKDNEVADLEENNDDIEVISNLEGNPIDCGEKGKIRCPVCQGKGVIIKKKAFEFEYRTCPYSDKNGFMSCEDYNLLLKGELVPQDNQ